MNIPAGHVSLTLLESHTIAVANYPFGLFHKTSGLQFNPTFAWPLKDTGSPSWFTERVLSLILIKLKDQSDQKQGQQGPDKAMGQWHISLLCTCPSVFGMGRGQDALPLVKPLLIIGADFKQSFLLLLWAASLCKHSEKPSKWEAGFAISVEGCFPGHACAMAQPGDSMPKNSSCWCNVPAPPRLIRPSHSFLTAPNQAATWRCC